MGWFKLSVLEFPCDIAEAYTTRTEGLNFKMFYNLNSMVPDFFILRPIRLSITKKKKKAFKHTLEYVTEDLILVNQHLLP